VPIIYPQLDGIKINEDRTLPQALVQAIRRAYDYLSANEKTSQDIINSAPNDNGGGGGGGTDDGEEGTGPVIAISFAKEVGTRRAGTFDRLVHLTVGFTPVIDGTLPRTVTYLISNDNRVTWVWVGSQRLRAVDQVLLVDRLAITDDANWAVAAVAGNQGGDPTPLTNAKMLELYPDVFISAPFLVLGLHAPPLNASMTATIGNCSNVVTSDGLTQYGVIPGVIYHDPINSTDFFVRITVQELDAAKNPIGGEQAHGGTQITNGTHTEKELLVTYTPGLAFIRYRFYVANRISQGDGDFADPTTNTLQQVSFNGGAPADHYDVPITIPTFIPIDPDDVFNVLSVTGREVGPKYQDEKAGLHTVVGFKPVIDVSFTKSHTVTLWLDFGNGVKVWQGWYSITFAGQEITIGQQTLGSDGTRKSGTIWVPANTAQGNWKVWCAAGRIDKGIDPIGYATSTFTVIPVAACSPNGITNCHFIADPNTNDPITYYKDGLGHWFWEYYRLEWTPPTQAAEPDFWFAMITIQKGATINGTWTPAPDPEGRNADPYLNYLGRVHDQILTVAGLALDQTTIMQRSGAYPSTWVIPPTQNVDLSPYLYREFRFLMYSVSRLGTDSSGSGGSGTYTLQTSCWPGGTDHFILSPEAKVGDLDLRYANPNTIGAGLQGGGGTVIDIDGAAISTYIPDDAILARHMHEDSITAANKALAANSIVDANVIDVGVAKLISGTNIFTGDVILSRGSTKPVIILQNSGINLFGVSDSTAVPPGAGGLTSKPNVAIQSTGISLFSGVDPSVTITPSAITFWSKNGDTTKPYSTMSSAGLFVTDGATTPNTLALGSTGLTVIDSAGAKLTINGGIITLLMARSVAGNGNTQAIINGSGASFTTGTGTGLMELIMDNTGLFLRRGGVNGASVAFSATAITLQNGSSGPQVNITSGQIALTNGTSSVTLTPTTVTIVNGSFTSPVINGGSLNIATASGMSVKIDNTTAGVQVSGNSGTETARVSSNVISVYGVTVGSELSPLSLLVGRFSSPDQSCGFNSSTGGGLYIAGKNRCGFDGVWKGGLQWNDHVYAGDFGIMPGGVAGSVGAVGVSGTFTTANGKTVTVWGGIITAIV
jgi:hypothetical protein